MYFCGIINQKEKNMKKLFTILCAAILSLGVSAQTETGNIIMGVTSDFSFSSTTLDIEGAEAVSTMGLNVQGGYFVMDNLAAMALLGYNKEGDFDAVTSFGIGARYYMNSIYAQVAYIIPGEDLSQIHISAGYAHMLTDNISLEPSLSYDMLSWDGESYSSTIGLKIGFGLYF